MTEILNTLFMIGLFVFMLAKIIRNHKTQTVQARHKRIRHRRKQRN